jgi:hypothetical protein
MTTFNWICFDIIDNKTYAVYLTSNIRNVSICLVNIAICDLKLRIFDVFKSKRFNISIRN